MDKVGAGYRHVAAEAKCPSCSVPLGNATSILAFRLVENMKHECSNKDCDEMVAFHLFEEHLKVCQHRLVSCPGPDQSCKLLLPLGQLEEHIQHCPGVTVNVNPNPSLHRIHLSADKVRKGKDIAWQTALINFEEKMFFLRRRRLSSSFQFEVVLAGTEAESDDFSARISLLSNNRDGRTYMQVTSHPRPISQVSWGHTGLTVPEHDLRRAIQEIGAIQENGDYTLFVEVGITSWK